MEKVVRLYPKVAIQGKSFKGVKRAVVPNQSMSLREIIKRFVRRESLPIMRDGVYEERFGDLEKLSKADITIQMDSVESLRKGIAEFEKRQKDKKEAAAKKDQVHSPPAGEKPIDSPPPKGA